MEALGSYVQRPAGEDIRGEAASMIVYCEMDGGCAVNPPTANTVVAAEGTKKRSDTDATGDGDGRWVGMNKKMKRSHEYDEMGGCFAKAGMRKRWYEYSKHEEDRDMDKMFRCNYWEDPAYAPKLQSDGLHLARTAAMNNFSELALTDTHAHLGRP